jgi:hypothetical protein
MKPSVCVEIGSASGRSTCYIGLARRENQSGVLYAIDPHIATYWSDDASIDTYEVLNRNIAALGLSRQMEMLRGFSEEIARSWEHEIDLLFIGGDHSYEGVRRDWDLFSRHPAVHFGWLVPLITSSHWAHLRRIPDFFWHSGVQPPVGARLDRRKAC